MLIEKEVIRPGTYFYRDEQTGLPRKLVVTPELTRYWHEQGNAMLSTGLTVPVPCEHDFDSHPMTPADKLKSNAGWVKEYRLKGDALFSTIDVTDDDIRKKLPHTIRWTSPWINSFTDGKGREWKNVISHLALTTRPRIVDQQPFASIAAALSLATEIKATGVQIDATAGGFCLSRAGYLGVRKRDKRLRPRFPIAFSLFSGAALGEDDFPPKKSKKPEGQGGEPEGGEWEDDSGAPPEGDLGAGGDLDNTAEGMIDLPPLGDPAGDVKMEELLCDLLQALGVPMPDESNEQQFRRHLYEAVMSKIKELTSKGMGADDPTMKPPDQNKPPNQNPNASQPQPTGQNPLIQQEQQPMFMSLEEINKLADPMKSVALAMYTENQKLRAEMETSRKVSESLRDAKLKEAAAARATRVSLIARVMPNAKADLDAMLAMPGMALSLGEGGAVVDPMAATLAVLEKGLANLPRLLTADPLSLSVQPHPRDADEMTQERIDEIADGFARQMGCPPQTKAS